jgi:hypothetical protein
MRVSLTCREGVRDLMRYQEGVLDEALRLPLEAHVAGCVRCQAFARSYTALPAILREATRTTLPAGGQVALRRALSSRTR